MSVSVVRPKCLENLKKGLLPQKMDGKKNSSIKSWGDAMLTLNGKYLQLNIGLKKQI